MLLGSIQHMRTSLALPLPHAAGREPMSDHFYQCLDCGFADTDKEQFRLIRYKDVGYCIDCAEALKERL